MYRPLYILKSKMEKQQAIYNMLALIFLSWRTNKAMKNTFSSSPHPLRLLFLLKARQTRGISYSQKREVKSEREQTLEEKLQEPRRQTKKSPSPGFLQNTQSFPDLNNRDRQRVCILPFFLFSFSLQGPEVAFLTFYFCEGATEGSHKSPSFLKGYILHNYSTISNHKCDMGTMCV